jgi:hypothetical protein
MRYALIRGSAKIGFSPGRKKHDKESYRDHAGGENFLENIF